MKLNIREIAELLKVRVRDVYDLVDREGLPAVRVQGQIQVHRDALFEWAATHGRRLPSDYFAKGGAAELLEAFHRGGSHSVAQVDGLRAVAVALLGTLPLPPNAPRNALADAMAARPGLGFRAAPEGLAVQRLHEPLILDAPPAVSLCVFDHPPLPGFEARAFLVVASPTVRQHHRLVGELHAVLHDATVRAALVEGAAWERVSAAIRAAAPHAAAAK